MIGARPEPAGFLDPDGQPDAGAGDRVARRAASILSRSWARASAGSSPCRRPVEHPSRISQLVLLAPALDFDGNRLSELGDRGLEAWKSSNQLAVFHYGYGRMMPVHYDLYADARRYNAFEAHLSISRFRSSRAASTPRSNRRRSNDGRRPDRTSSFTCSTMTTNCSRALKRIWAEMERFLQLARG